MKRFRASVWSEGEQFVAQCLDIDIASPGATEDEALAALKEALQLHFTPPVATLFPEPAALETGANKKASPHMRLAFCLIDFGGG